MNATPLTTPQDHDESPQTWSDWIREYSPRLLLFARQYSNKLSDAEDILQEALVRLVKKVKAHEFQGGRQGWVAFVYTAIRHISIDMFRSDVRRQNREQQAYEHSLIEHDEEPWFNSDELSTSHSFLEEQLKKLPKEEARVIVLRYWSDLTFKEIAQVLELSPNTVASRFRYGIEKLKKALRGYKNER